MFWRKKEEVDEVEFGVRTAYSIQPDPNRFTYRETAQRFLAYRFGETWNGLVGYEEYKEKTDLLNNKLDLILKELGKEYVPESSKTEPAKLVDKIPTLNDLIHGGFSAGTINCDDSAKSTMNTTKPKKKRGRPKGSKTKK